MPRKIKMIKQNNIEDISIGKKLVATVIRKGFNKSGLSFLTNQNEPIQMAIHNYSDHKDGRIHTEVLKRKIQVSEIQKFLYLEKGKVRVTLFDSRKNKIASKILKSGDSIIVKRVDHKFDFYPKSRAFEVKQGPYES